MLKRRKEISTTSSFLYSSVPQLKLGCHINMIWQLQSKHKIFETKYSGKWWKISHKMFIQCFNSSSFCACSPIWYFILEGLRDKQFAKTYFHRWYRKLMSLFICYTIERKSYKLEKTQLLLNFENKSIIHRCSFLSNWIFTYMT